MNAEELRLYLDKVRTVTPQALEGEGLCKGCLGFYLVRFIILFFDAMQCTATFCYVMLCNVISLYIILCNKF